MENLQRGFRKDVVLSAFVDEKMIGGLKLSLMIMLWTGPSAKFEILKLNLKRHRRCC